MTTFSPRSQGTTSTLSNPSLLSHQLQKALGAVATERALLPGLDISLLGPRSGLSLEKMQRSLSSSEGEKTLETSHGEELLLDGVAYKSHGANKSVNFAAKTEICQVLATPQVSPGLASVRPLVLSQVMPGACKFRLESGQTKTSDGRTDLSRRLLAQQNSSRSGEQTLPLLPSTSLLLPPGHQSLLSSTGLEDRGQQQAYSVNLLSELLPHMNQEEDPHLLLNASKAPTPNQEWLSPTASEWEGEDMELNLSILPMDMMANVSDAESQVCRCQCSYF